MKTEYQNELIEQLSEAMVDAQSRIAELEERRQFLLSALQDIQVEIVRETNNHNAMESAISNIDPDLALIKWHFSTRFDSDLTDSHLVNPFMISGKLDFDPDEVVPYNRNEEMLHDAFHKMFNFRSLDGNCTIYATSGIEIAKAFNTLCKMVEK